LTTKLDEVTQVMKEHQFELTCSAKVRQVRVNSNIKTLERTDGGENETDKADQTREILGATESHSNENLETTISGEPTTFNVTEHIGQERATLTRFIGSQGNNISGETTTNHTHSEKIDTVDETDSQY